MAFNRYLLSPQQAIFFDNREQGLKAWTQYALSRSLLKNAEQAQADSLFALSEEERSEKKLQAQSLRAEAEELLAQLSQQEAVTSVALATKIMAKEILQRL
jgi:beta-phosphoglucomutase-like phosphatase (HAD superfamily)